MSKQDNQNPRIEPLFYRAFPRIFGRAESKELTRSLVNAVLTHAGLDPVPEIERIDAEHTALGGTVDCKMPRMDIRIIAHDRLIDLESQRYPEDVNNRSMLYGAQLLTENTPGNVGYKDIPQAIVITLLDTAPLFPNASEYVHTSKMSWNVDDDTVEGTDRIVFVVVELEKVRKRYNRLSSEVLADELLSWAYLLTVGYERSEEVTMLAAKIPSVEDFAKLYGLAVDDPKVKRAHEDAVSAEREYQSRKDYLERIEREAAEKAEEEGRKRGEAIGLERGIEQGLERGEAIGLERGEAIGLERGIEQGLERGMAQGLERGMEQGLERGMEQGLERGMEQGLERGEAIGREKALLASILALAESLEMPAIDAMEALNIPAEERAHYLELLNSKA